MQSMPFLLSFASFCNSLVWASYGVIKKDKFIYVRRHSLINPNHDFFSFVIMLAKCRVEICHVKLKCMCPHGLLQIPNGLGTLLTLGQLFLWCTYYKKGVRKSAIDSATTQHAIDMLTANKLTQQPSMGTHEVSADHFDVSQNSKKLLNENNTALMALCRDQP